MKNVKRLLVLAFIAVFAIGLLAGCGGNSDGGDAEGSDDKVIVVGATPSPHAEILEAIRGEIEAEGYTLEIKEFTEYTEPNPAVTDGDLDANYFQHQPYLDDYNEQTGEDLVGVQKIHYEPLGIYKGKKSSIDELSDGDKVGVPNDTTNEARALQLLEAQGLITLKDGVGLEATKADIEDNPKNLDIVELDAATITTSLPDLELAVINGNYALSGGLTSDDAIAFEASDSEAAQTFGNVVAVRNGEENSEKTQVLLKALTSDTAKEFIESKYQGSVVPLF